MSSYRPRRSRIYGANYDIGESYYKKQLDELDNKRGVRRSVDRANDLYSDFAAKDDKYTPKVSFMQDTDDADTFKLSKIKPLSKAYLDDFDEEPLKLNLRSYTSRPDPADDLDLGIDSVRKSIFKKSHDITNGSSLLNDLDIQDQSSFTSRRKMKISTENYFSEDKSAAEEVATSRAKATKARLADLEMEMMNISDKQTERQNRNRSLRKLLSETDSDALISVKK